MEDQATPTTVEKEEQIDEQPVEHPSEPTNGQQEQTINQDKLNRYMERLKLEQNLPSALLTGFIASIIGAILWAAVTVITEYQIGFMAITVGLLVGFAIRYFGRGIDKIFGIIGGVFAIFGCLLGNLFSILGFYAISVGIGIFDILGLINLSVIPDLMVETFSPIDLLFYGLAIYEGYKFSFRKITEEEIIANAAE